MPIQGGKSYYDSEFWVTIPPSTNPHKKRKKPVEETITVVTPVKEENSSEITGKTDEIEENKGEESSVVDASSPTSACSQKEDCRHGRKCVCRELAHYIRHRLR